MEHYIGKPNSTSRPARYITFSHKYPWKRNKSIYYRPYYRPRYGLNSNADWTLWPWLAASLEEGQHSYLKLYKDCCYTLDTDAIRLKQKTRNISTAVHNLTEEQLSWILLALMGIELQKLWRDGF